MKIDYGKGETEYGPGVDIKLTGEEVATAINAYLVAHGVHISGPRTIRVNGKLCESGGVYVDPMGFVVFNGERKCGGGPSKEDVFAAMVMNRSFGKDDGVRICRSCWNKVPCDRLNNDRCDRCSHVKEPTEYQRSLMEHTLGGKDPGKWFRNHFVESPGHTDLPDIRELEKLGLMKEIPAPSFCDDETIQFVVTGAGKDFLRHEINDQLDVFETERSQG
jgi:hypothetical protein